MWTTKIFHNLWKFQASWFQQTEEWLISKHNKEKGATNVNWQLQRNVMLCKNASKNTNNKSWEKNLFHSSSQSLKYIESHQTCHDNNETWIFSSTQQPGIKFINGNLLIHQGLKRHRKVYMILVTFPICSWWPDCKAGSTSVQDREWQFAGKGIISLDPSKHSTPVHSATSEN
jgi:hypothetical protein